MSEAEQQEWGENYAKSDKRIQKQKQDKSQFKRSEQVNSLEQELAYYTSEWGKMQTDYEKHEKIAKADLPKMCELTTRLQSLRNEMLKSQSGINLNTTDINEIPALNLVKEYAKEML